MNTKTDLTVLSRILIAFASGMLIAVFFLPAWRIDLYAPQYPEGLMMNIWINRLSGDVDIINGLNHYIGMKHFSNASFPEFKYLHFVVYFFIGLGLLVSLTGKKRLLQLYLILTVAGGLLAFIDFYKWGYEYGHDLDPKAAIQIPGLTYQPPVFGHKRLLNFDAYSFPDIGGWIVIASAVLCFLVLFYEWYKNRKNKTGIPKAVVLLLGLFMLGPVACTINPEPLVPGKDACSYCKMTIVETEYGSEIITRKGRLYKFDDISCMTNFIHSNAIKKEDIKITLVSNFHKKNEFLSAETAWFYSGPLMKSPMGSNTGAFTNEDAAALFKGDKVGVVMNWSTILARR